MKLAGLIFLLLKRYKEKQNNITKIDIKRLTHKSIILSYLDRVFLLWRSVWPSDCWSKSFYNFSSFCPICKKLFITVPFLCKNRFSETWPISQHNYRWLLLLTLPSYLNWAPGTDPAKLMGHNWKPYGQSGGNNCLKQ